MVVGRYEMFKDTLGSDWKKNKIIGGAVSELSRAATPPPAVAQNIYGSGQSEGQVLSRNSSPSLSSPPPMLAQQPAPNPAIARMQNNAGATGLGQTARQMLASNPSPPPAAAPFKSTLKSGITYEGDTQGNRTYTMGTPGQDGYGRITVSPGTGQRSAAANQLAAGVQRPNNGYEVSGDPNAVARFNRPVSNPGNPAPDALNGGSRAAMLEQQTAQQRLAATPQAPKYMTKEEGIAAGVGWKGRGQIYAQQMDAYNKATGNQNALDVEQMREGGAGARAMLAAQGVNDRNAIEREGQQSANEIARKRLTGELALNDTRIGTEQLGQQKGKFELSSLQAQNAARDEYMKNPTPENELKYRGAIGKFEKEAQFGTVGRYDDQGTKVGEDLYNKQTGELRGGGNQDPAMSIIESNPNYKQAYQSADPKKQQEMIKALRERMAQGSK